MRIFLSVRRVLLRLTGDAKIPASMVVGAGALRSRRCARRWMLKKVPVWGLERGRRPDGLCPSSRRPPPDFVHIICCGRRILRRWAGAIGAGTPSREKPVKNLATPATGQEARPKPGPDRPNRTGTETRFSIPSRTVPARSRQPRSDNHRSRNHVAARKPKRNSPHVHRDPQSKPNA